MRHVCALIPPDDVESSDERPVLPPHPAKPRALLCTRDPTKNQVFQMVSFWHENCHFYVAYDPTHDAQSFGPPRATLLHLLFQFNHPPPPLPASRDNTFPYLSLARSIYDKTAGSLSSQIGQKKSAKWTVSPLSHWRWLSWAGWLLGLMIGISSGQFFPVCHVIGFLYGLGFLVIVGVSIGFWDGPLALKFLAETT